VQVDYMNNNTNQKHHLFIFTPPCSTMQQSSAPKAQVDSINNNTNQKHHPLIFTLSSFTTQQSSAPKVCQVPPACDRVARTLPPSSRPYIDLVQSTVFFTANVSLASWRLCVHVYRITHSNSTRSLDNSSRSFIFLLYHSLYY
jgi:hypothetical protein